MPPIPAEPASAPPKGRGGPGRGQGPKRKPEAERLVARTIRLTPAQWTTLADVGVADWLRPQLDALAKLRR